MMNWEATLTTLWNKVSKPITNILIGLAFLIFAPGDLVWLGWIFLAIGVGGFLDKQSYFFKNTWDKILKGKKIKEELEHLTRAEESILKLMVQHNKRIMRQPDFEDALSKKIPGRSQKLPSVIYSVFTSLEDKNLAYFNSTGFGHFNVTAREHVWEILKKRYKEDFNTENKKKQKEKASEQ